MLTVREALKLPIFEGSQLVAGAAGLENLIRWVHIVDMPDANFEWRRRGVLLLTAGLGLVDNPTQQKNLIPKLVNEGFAGLVLSVGYYFDHVPEVMRETADSLNFPIIETPRKLLFINITEAILGRIVNQQYVLLQQSNEIYAELTRLVLQGANLDVLAKTLAGLLRRSVTIEDMAFRVLGDGTYGPVDEVREEAIRNGRTPAHIAQQLVDTGIYHKLLETMGSLYVAPRPEWGLTLERYVAPIIVDSIIYGCIWIIAGEKPLTDLDELTISHGATVAALMLFKDEAVRKVEETLRGDFFEQLLHPGQQSANFVEQARKLHYDLEKPHQVVLIHGVKRGGGNGRFLLNDVETWLRHQQINPLLVWHNEQLVLLLESGKTEIGLRLAQKMSAALIYPTHQLLIGVGETCAQAVPDSYAEALEAIHIAQIKGQQAGVAAFADLGVLHWLYHLPPEQQANNAYLQHIHTIAAYDEKRHTELVKTLETYLDQGASLVEASQVLFVHRNTLLHRLDRIETLCQMNLRDPLVQLNFHVALKGYRLFG
jgi:purine catabolism regulator